MQLEKKTVVDKIEINENGVVHIRTATKIYENGGLLSSSFHRHTVMPGQNFTQQDSRVQAVCAAIHTQEVIDAFNTSGV